MGAEHKGSLLPESTRKMPQATTLGVRLKKARDDKGLTIRGLSALTRSPRVSAAYISRIENDERAPRPHIVAALATALGMPVGDLMGDNAAGAVDLSAGGHMSSTARLASIERKLETHTVLLDRLMETLTRALLSRPSSEVRGADPPPGAPGVGQEGP